MNRPTPSRPGNGRPDRPTWSRPEPLWTLAQLAEYLNLSPKTLYNWRTKGLGPPAIIIGGALRWKRSEVERWVAEQQE